MIIYKLYQQVADLEESEERPVVKVDPTTIDLGRVSYVHPLILIIEIQLFEQLQALYNSHIQLAEYGNCSSSVPSKFPSTKLTA